MAVFVTTHKRFLQGQKDLLGGVSFATEFDPKTGSTRQWMESYGHAGEVIRFHPKSINGQPVDTQHYPPTGAELKSWGQQ